MPVDNKYTDMTSFGITKYYGRTVYSRGIVAWSTSIPCMTTTATQILHLCKYSIIAQHPTWLMQWCITSLFGQTSVNGGLALPGSRGQAISKQQSRAKSFWGLFQLSLHVWVYNLLDFICRVHLLYLVLSNKVPRIISQGIKGPHNPWKIYDHCQTRRCL